MTLNEIKNKYENKQVVFKEDNSIILVISIYIENSIIMVLLSHEILLKNNHMKYNSFDINTFEENFMLL